MWVIMNNSFLSIVENKDNSDQLLVRARVKKDITKIFPSAKIVYMRNADYQFRSFIDREIVADVLRGKILDINYGNFKNSVTSENRHSVYMHVWIVLQSLMVWKGRGKTVGSRWPY